MTWIDAVKRMVSKISAPAAGGKAQSGDVAKELGFFRKLSDQAAAETRPLVIHRRSDVIKEYGMRPPPPLVSTHPVARGGSVHEQRRRDIINESLGIAMKTKRRDTAESRLQVVEDLLDELAEAGLESAEDRVNRHTMIRLREGLDRRFPPKRKK